MLATRPASDTPLGARDRALLLLGFAGALRRSELVGLALGDIEVVPQRGLRLLICRSKTDQRGAGQAIALWANPREPGLCPARALAAWLGFRQGGGDRTGGAPDAALPVFVGLSKAGRLSGLALSDKAVWRLVKQAARDAGLADPEGYSGHSLRAGLAAIMRQTRHRSAKVALGYLRPAELWRNNASQKVWDNARDRSDDEA